MSQSPTETSSASQQSSYQAGWSALHQLIADGKSFSGFERNCCFLNTGDARFADVSAASGLDFLDDGRAVAVVDWDHDGDLDLWVTNRTAPSVRFLRNDIGSQRASLALRLNGRTCNRNAIGARVELTVGGGRDSVIVKSVRGGEGFLAQSSKWLHFGLGRTNSKPMQAVVHWPGGQSETFTNLHASRRYQLIQGAGQAVEIKATRTVKLSASVPDLPQSTDTGRVITLGNAAPVFPVSEFRDTSGETRPISGLPEGPQLVVLWAGWCQPCLEELAEIAKRESELRDAGIEVLSIDVGGLGGTEEPEATSRPGEYLDRINFPFRRGKITESELNLVEALQKQLVSKANQFALPTSFLLDEQRRVVAMYRGGITVEDILRDVSLTTADEDARRNAAVPFAGRWMGPIGADGDAAIGIGDVVSALLGDPLKSGIALVVLLCLAVYVIRSRRRRRAELSSA